MIGKWTDPDRDRKWQVVRGTPGGVFVPVLKGAKHLTLHEASLIREYLMIERPTTAYAVQKIISTHGTHDAK